MLGICVYGNYFVVLLCMLQLSRLNDLHFASDVYLVLISAIVQLKPRNLFMYSKSILDHHVGNFENVCVSVHHSKFFLEFLFIYKKLCGFMKHTTSK